VRENLAVRRCSKHNSAISSMVPNSRPDGPALGPAGPDYRPDDPA
jgi:hypothetical protein